MILSFIFFHCVCTIVVRNLERILHKPHVLDMEKVSLPLYVNSPHTCMADSSKWMATLDFIQRAFNSPRYLYH